jgi:predicted RNA-binding protein YlqC (UPF0109 family)
MLKDLVEYIVKSLVDKPEVVHVTQEDDNTKCIIRVKVGELDLGRVIGKDGQTIRAIRALAIAIAPQGQEISIDVSK